MAVSLPRMHRLALRAVAVLVFLCATLWTGAVAWLWANETRIVFRAWRSRVISPLATGVGSLRDAQLIELRNADGDQLDAVVLPAASPSPYWILFCSPAAGTIHGRLQSQLHALHELGYNVFAFDYRGFGRNP